MVGINNPSPWFCAAGRAVGDLLAYINDITLSGGAAVSMVINAVAAIKSGLGTSP